MIGYDLYRIYEPINLHFNSTYDVFKYKGVIKYGSRSKYDSRQDKYIFEKFANRINSPKTAGQICLANFVYNERDWLYHDPAEVFEVYNRWKGSISDIRLRFSEQIDELVTIAKENGIEAEALFKPTPSGKYPPAMQLFIRGKVHKETIVILSNYHDFISEWIDKYDFDPLISDQLFLLKKYKPFIVTRENQRDFNEASKLIFRTF